MQLAFAKRCMPLPFCPIYSLRAQDNEPARPAPPRMRFASYFAGIGGFDLGLERAGMQCVGQVEIDPYCLAVLKKHWPDVMRLDDIRKVRGDEFGATDLICGGYPCQCDSGAGLMRGQDDDRWLWPELFRIVKSNRPTWFVGENVINHENMGLKVVISDLVSIGYQVRPFIIPNAACELPTVERHIWIIAAASCDRLQRGKDIPDSYYREERQFQRDDSGERDRWALPESRVRRARQGLPLQVDRIKALGNAVAPQIVEVIGRAIVQIEESLRASCPALKEGAQKDDAEQNSNSI
jgi:DNA (cytosine-5)-methyltransferase 1